VLRAALAEVAAPLVVRLPARRLERLLAPLGPPAPEERANEVLGAVEGAFRLHPVERTCLTRGIALCYLLRRSGFDVALAFGVGQEGEDWRGHCWLVRDGRPYLEDHELDGRFTALLTIPGAAS
jgi:hypothetical protein